MITSVPSLLTFGSPMGAQNEFVYSILPMFAIALGVICVASYVTTRVIKRFI